MVGANVSCGEWQSGIWKCDLTRSGTYHGYALWTTGGTRSVSLPATWNVTHSRDLTGNRTQMNFKSSVQVGVKPVLFETGAP
jgi:hypothetical protein